MTQLTQATRKPSASCLPPAKPNITAPKKTGGFMPLSSLPAFAGNAIGYVASLAYVPINIAYSSATYLGSLTQAQALCNFDEICTSGNLQQIDSFLNKIGSNSALKADILNTADLTAACIHIVKCQTENPGSKILEKFCNLFWYDLNFSAKLSIAKFAKDTKNTALATDLINIMSPKRPDYKYDYDANYAQKEIAELAKDTENASLAKHLINTMGPDKLIGFAQREIADLIINTENRDLAKCLTSTMDYMLDYSAELKISRLGDKKESLELAQNLIQEEGSMLDHSAKREIAKLAKDTGNISLAEDLININCSELDDSAQKEIAELAKDTGSVRLAKHLINKMGDNLDTEAKRMIDDLLN